jgi:hypothetical protein
MIECHDIPGIGGAMTGITLFSGLNMGCMLAGGGGAVVTGRAKAYRFHGSMVKTGITPVVGRVMAGIALFSGLNMGNMLAGCPYTIMAG